MRPARSHPVIIGLSAADLEQTVERFFRRFAWEGVQLDPDTMTAAAFFERF